jgi:hypothetical protein
MSDERVCIVKLIDIHGVEHRVKVQAESVYEAALRGLKRLQQVGWESDGSQISSVMVEVWEEPTKHLVNVKKPLNWLRTPGNFPPTNSGKRSCVNWQSDSL